MLKNTVTHFVPYHSISEACSYVRMALTVHDRLGKEWLCYSNNLLIASIWKSNVHLEVSSSSRGWCIWSKVIILHMISLHLSLYELVFAQDS